MKDNSEIYSINVAFHSPQQQQMSCSYEVVVDDNLNEPMAVNSISGTILNVKTISPGVKFCKKFIASWRKYSKTIEKYEQLSCNRLQVKGRIHKRHVKLMRKFLNQECLLQADK